MPVADILAKRIKPPEVDAFGPLKYVPHSKQQIFHKMSRDRVDSILFGGAAGGGKSCALMMESIWCACNFPGMSILCVRRTYNELEESFIKELRKRGYAQALGAKWNQTKMQLSFPNGSLIRFTYAENEQDASRVQGGEYQMICVDEASLMDPAVLGMVAERLRSGERNIPVMGLRLATNPGGIGGKDLRDKFIEPTNWGDKGVVLELDQKTKKPILNAHGEPKRVVYIHSKYTDNPYIDPGYEAILNSIADPNRRRAMRDGDWDAMVGAFFPQWTRFRHVIPAKDCFVPPLEWIRYCGIDYGIREPFAAEWAAVDNDGRMWIYRELTMADLEAKEQAKAILEAERAAGEDKLDRHVIRVADPSMWGNRGTPLSIADIYGIEGCGIAKADNDRLTGYARFHSVLNEAPACEYHRNIEGWGRLDGEDGPPTCPLLHVMESGPNGGPGGAPELIDNMPNLPRSKTKPEDSETKGVKDHTIDAARYMIGMAGTSARPVIYNDGPLDAVAVASLYQESQVAFSTGYDTTKLVAGKYAGTLAPQY